MLTRIIGLGVTACAGFRLWQLLRARSQSSTIYGAFPALQLTPLLRSHHADDTHKVTPEYSSAQERYAGRRINVHLLDMRISSRPPSDPQLQQMLRATVIGMDAEWEPETSGTRSRIALLQLSTGSACALIRVLGCRQLPRWLAQLLSSPAVIKLGVGIAEDARRLAKDFGVIMQGHVDLRAVAQAHCPRLTANGSSLQALAGAALGLQLDKALQRSSWGAEQLTDAQIRYAAADAWLAVEIADHMHHSASSTAAERQQQQQQQQQQQEHPQQQQPTSSSTDEHPQEQQQRAPAPGTSSTSKPSPAAAQPTLHALLQPFTTSPLFHHKSARRLQPPRAKLTGSSTAAAGAADAGSDAGSSAAGSSAGQQQHRVRQMDPSRLPTRKSVLYENCRLLAPDAAVLCTCSRKKVLWYVERGLGDIVQQEPLTVQLRFEPRGRGHADDKYYLSDKQNRCSVCGKDGDYLRHSIVPHCYRQHFPPHMKSHLSHDIVLMCGPCHQAANIADHKRMEALGQQYGAPLADEAKKFSTSAELGGVRSAGRALAHPKAGAIPQERREALMQVLRQHYQVAEVTLELVQQAAEVDPKCEEAGWVPHAQRVVQQLQGEEQIEEFVRGWRRHFLAVMKPQHLPPYWSVDSRVANSAAPQASG